MKQWLLLQIFSLDVSAMQRMTFDHATDKVDCVVLTAITSQAVFKAHSFPEMGI